MASVTSGTPPSRQRRRRYDPAFKRAIVEQTLAPGAIDMLHFVELKAPEAQVREAAEVLGARLRNLRALGQ